MEFSLQTQQKSFSTQAALSYEVIVRGAHAAPVSVEFASQSFSGPNAANGVEGFRVKLVLGNFEATALAVALLEMAAEPLTESQDWPEQALRFGLAGDGPGAPPAALPKGYLSAIAAATEAVRSVVRGLDDPTA